MVTTEDGRVSFSFHHVHFGLWDVMFSVLSSRGSDDPSVIAGPISDPFSAPCLEAYLSVPVGCHFSLLSIPFQGLWVFFSPAHLLQALYSWGLLFQIHSDSLCFLILPFSSRMFISVIDKADFRTSVLPHPSGL